MTSSTKQFADSYKSKFKDTLGKHGISINAINTVLSLLGATWAPELLLKGKITQMPRIVGSGIWLSTLLLSAQIAGLKGVTLHSIVWGCLNAPGLLIVALDDDDSN